MDFQKKLLVLLLMALVPMAYGRSPNIIFILADDMGYGDAAYAGGKIATPRSVRKLESSSFQAASR